MIFPLFRDLSCIQHSIKRIVIGIFQISCPPIFIFSVVILSFLGALLFLILITIVVTSFSRNWRALGLDLPKLYLSLPDRHFHLCISLYKNQLLFDLFHCGYTLMPCLSSWYDIRKVPILRSLLICFWFFLGFLVCFSLLFLYPSYSFSPVWISD